MKAICVINTSGNYGGAEKRFVSLFNHIDRKGENFRLIINRSLYDTMIEKGILNTQSRVLLITIPFDKKTYTKIKKSTSKKNPVNNSGRTLHNRLGRFKYLLKTVIQWVLFSVQLIYLLKINRITNVYTIWQGGIWGRVWYKMLNIKLIYGANSNLVWYLDKKVLSRFDSQYRILRDANHVDFLSAGLIDELKSQMPPKDFPENYSVSPCSFINYENYFPEHPKENAVIFMGRLVALKNPMLFMEAVKLFNKTFNHSNEIKFIILGTGPFENEIQTFIQKHRLSNVSLPEKVLQPEIHLRKSKVFITIQQTENYPSQALIEAMACENAIIASDVGETRKIVTDNEGILVKLDTQDIAKALTELLSNDENCFKAGKNARKKVMQEHTIEMFTEYFYTLND